MIILKKHHWSAVIAPKCGANLISLTYQDIKILRETPGLEALSRTPALYGVPVLFPPNRIASGEFIFEGRKCRLPLNEPDRNNHLHDLAISEKWAMNDSTTDRLEMKFIHSATADFPFTFQLTLTYLIQPDHVCQTLTVTNNNSYTMCPAASASIPYSWLPGECI